MSENRKFEVSEVELDLSLLVVDTDADRHSDPFNYQNFDRMSDDEPDYLSDDFLAQW